MDLQIYLNIKQSYKITIKRNKNSLLTTTDLGKEVMFAFG